MKGKIEETLGTLIGLTLASIGRSCDLEWFQFGKLIEVSDGRGNKKRAGEHAIHIQCAWRITGPAGIIVASQDTYHPREGWEGNEEDFDWDVQGENRSDQLVDNFLRENSEKLLIVKAVQADRFGGFVLELSNDTKLEAFPNGTAHVEYWRHFKPYSGEPHFIITSDGLEEG